MPSLPIEGWAVAHVEMEQSISSWAEPNEVFLLRRPRCWTLVTLTMASRPDGDGSPLRGRSTLSTEEFAFTEDLAEAVRARYYEAGWIRLLDAGQDDPDLYAASSGSMMWPTWLTGDGHPME